MAVVALLSVSILLFLAFVAKTKRLPAPAIAFCWMTAVFVKDALFNVAMLNLKLIEVPPELPMLYLRMLNLYILAPSIVVWSVDSLLAERGPRRRSLRRALAGPIAVFALFGADASMAGVGAWKPTLDEWGWLSFSKAAFVYAVALLLTGRFVALLRREGVVR
ncbi:MAG TPA: hypothetical protein VEZ72_18025 [Paenibacillus sp.]|nr:hypothetical protein [Paenibacillus sp.]